MTGWMRAPSGARRRAGVRLAGLALHGAMLAGGAAAAQAADLRVCVDSSSAEAARDRAVAGRVATQAGLTLKIATFDGSGGGDDGFPLRGFRKLLTTQCDLVMGFPIDLAGGQPPPGLMTTKAYAQTGFVLVDAPGTSAGTLAELPAGSEVAITAETAPALFFPEGGSLVPDMHGSDADTLQSVVTGKVKAAMMWQPTVDRYEAGPGAVRLTTHPLDVPHARYDVVALYLPEAAPQGQIFNATRIALKAALPGSGAGVPALYTKAQAAVGFGKFIGNCAMCHGAHLEGRGGPSLKGPNWASAKADYTLGEVFTVVSQQMPATDPGSLGKDDYTSIMAYLLQQNGYPAGDTLLTFDGAAGSAVKLRWQGGG